MVHATTTCTFYCLYRCSGILLLRSTHCTFCTLWDWNTPATCLPPPTVPPPPHSPFYLPTYLPAISFCYMHSHSLTYLFTIPAYHIPPTTCLPSYHYHPQCSSFTTYVRSTCSATYVLPTTHEMDCLPPPPTTYLPCLPPFHLLLLPTYLHVPYVLPASLPLPPVVLHTHSERTLPTHLGSFLPPCITGHHFPSFSAVFAQVTFLPFPISPHCCVPSSPYHFYLLPCVLPPPPALFSTTTVRIPVTPLLRLPAGTDFFLALPLHAFPAWTTVPAYHYLVSRVHYTSLYLPACSHHH